MSLTKALRPEIQDPRQIAELALRGEKIFHGQPSGVDPYTVAFERPLLFRASDRSAEIVDFAPLTHAGLCFVLESSGKKHATQEVVEAVRGVREETPLLFSDAIDTLSTNVERIAKCLSRDPRAIGPWLDDSQARLRALGVSCNEIDDTIERLKSAGALGAKLTGSGRGGFVLGLFERSAADRYFESFSGPKTKGPMIPGSEPPALILWSATQS